MRDDIDGALGFARSWMRRLAGDISAGALAPPLPVALERVARSVLHSIFDHESPSLDLLRRCDAEGSSPQTLLASAPRDAGILRDLGRMVSSLRGSGVLGEEDPELIRLLGGFHEALQVGTARSLPAVPDFMRITREDLLGWADGGSGYELPELIRRLVTETTEGLDRVYFPGGVGATAGGWDGIVRTSRGNQYVPEGLSGWELSVNSKSSRKVEEDFAKRHEGPEGGTPGETTYVQVICRPWTGAGEFVASKANGSRWKAVRGYNVEDLVGWLELAPATTAWLAERLGRPISGVSTLDQWWDAWVTSTRIPLKATVVLAGRELQAESLRSRVAEAGVTTVGGEVTRQEVKAFVAATFQPSDPEQAPMRQALFVDDAESARRLLDMQGAMLLVVPSARHLTDRSSLGNHHVIVPSPGSDRADIVLPPVDSREVAKVLEESGLGGREASQLGELARRSLIAAQRHLANNRSLHEPAWAAPGADVTRRRVLLCGSWNETVEGDREAVAAFIGASYAAVQDVVRSMAADPEYPMIAVVDERWHVVSAADSWLLLGNQLTSEDIEAFAVMAKTVLLEPDPYEGMDENQRWRAMFDGVKRTYSGDLARGIARGLALLGSTEGVRFAHGRTGAQAADSIVWQLFEGAGQDITAKGWVTLLPHLTLLGEAAPGVVLDSLQRLISETPPEPTALFADQAEGFHTNSPHTQVLWALEALAWSTEHFAQVVTLLADLAELDPGGRLSNRPTATLAAIFSPWHPNTSAPVAQRLAAVDRLRKTHPGVAWVLLRSMLPDSNAFQIGGSEPTFRPWKGSEPVVTRQEYAEVVEAAAAALLEDAPQSATRLIDLSKDLAKLSARDRLAAMDVLRAASANSDFEEVRGDVWETLRETVNHHREYADAKWALPADEIDRLAELADQIGPTDPRHRHSWLFDSGFVTLGDIKRRDDYKAYDQALATRRAEAVGEILADEGLAGLLNFAAGCELPGTVGSALAQAEGTQYQLELLPLLADAEAKLVDLAFAYFGALFRERGWEYIEHLLASAPDTSPLAKSRLLRTAWSPLEGGHRAEELGPEVAGPYWKEVTYYGLGSDFPDAIALAEQLRAAKRSAAALDLLYLYARSQSSNPELALAVAETFEDLMAHPDDPEIASLRHTEVDVLIRLLSDHRDIVGLDRAVKIEWYFLPALGYDPDAPALHEALSKEPQLFVDLVSLVFRPRSERDRDRPEIDDNARLAAENAYRVLHSWTRCPGSDQDGVIDGVKLEAWVTEARRLLQECDRVKIGDEQIGQILGAARPDTEDLWPPEPIRDLIENLRSTAIDQGIELRAHNDRGVTSRSMDEGGRQEWALASHHRAMAERLSIRWPRSAKIHANLAESYERWARREDAEAEHRRRGLDD
jgi:hypothetical protein